MKILISKKDIKKLVEKLADQLNQDFETEELIAICVLKGSIIFFADLIRRLKMPIILDFIQLSSYSGAETTGKVNIIKDLSVDIKDKNVLIVEDIIDTGLTLKCLKAILLKRQPKCLKVITLLDKPSRRKVKIKADYTGKKIPDEFVVGYGLDFKEQYRNLPHIAIVE